MPTPEERRVAVLRAAAEVIMAVQYAVITAAAAVLTVVHLSSTEALAVALAAGSCALGLVALLGSWWRWEWVAVTIAAGATGVYAVAEWTDFTRWTNALLPTFVALAFARRGIDLTIHAVKATRAVRRLRKG